MIRRLDPDAGRMRLAIAQREPRYCRGCRIPVASPYRACESCRAHGRAAPPDSAVVLRNRADDVHADRRVGRPTRPRARPDRTAEYEVSRARYAANVTAERARGQAYYASHRDDVLRRQTGRLAASRAADPDDVRRRKAAKNKRYRDRHADEERARKQAYRAAHHAEVLAHGAAYRAANREAIRRKNAARMREVRDARGTP